MKKALSILFISLLLFSSVFAETDSVVSPGDPNIDSEGGGGTGSGTGQNNWAIGDDGVRITVVEEETRKAVSKSVDFANKQQTVDYFFGYRNKLVYVATHEVNRRFGGEYKNIVPKRNLPSIISANGQNNVDAVKSYFREKLTLQDICPKLNFSYDDLIKGDYVLLLEPLVYMTYSGYKYAMTATEVALFDVLKNNDVLNKMGTLTHVNLPRAMYLVKSALGFSTPVKPFPKRSNNAQIIDTLGLGTVHFKPKLPEAPPSTNYTYRVNTDVITSVKVRADREYSPDNMGSVTFDIMGRRYTKYFVSPAGGEQLVWVRWHTPSTPQRIDIAVTSNSYVGASAVVANIVELEELAPPDPQFGDPAPNVSSSTLYQKNIDVHNWTVWTALWQEREGGFWKYERQEYFAQLEVKARITPNARVKTAFKLGYGKYEMKSGYGVDMEYTPTMYYSCSDYDVTHVQNASVTFPEFQHKTYNRLLMLTKTPSEAQRIMGFRPNKWSFYKEPTHFTPLRYPDGKQYNVSAESYDAWTPVGELKTTTQSDNMTINGNVYDDWYMRVMEGDDDK